MISSLSLCVMQRRLHVQNPSANREIRYPAASSDEAGIRPSAIWHDHLYSSDQAFCLQRRLPTAGAQGGTERDDAQLIRVVEESRPGRSSANILAVDGECSVQRRADNRPGISTHGGAVLMFLPIAHVGAHEHDGPARFESAG